MRLVEFLRLTEKKTVKTRKRIPPTDGEGNQHDRAWKSDWNDWGTHGMGKNGFVKPFSFSPDEHPGILLPGEVDPTGGDGIEDQMVVVKKS